MRRALTGGYGLQYNKLAVEPQRWLQSIPGVWGIADVTHYRVLDRWPRSTINIGWLNDIDLYCDPEVTMCFSWSWQYTDYAYIPEYYWEKSIDNGLTWTAVTQRPHDLSNTAIRIGHHATDDARYQVDGYIDDLRLSVGTGRYTHNFSVPPAHVADGQTALLLRFDGAYGSDLFFDSSNNNVNISRRVTYAWWFGGALFPTAATISTAQKKYGTGSLSLIYNDNYGLVDHLSADNAVLAPGRDDFCLEMWFYLNSYNNNYQQVQYGWGNYQLWSTLFDSRPTNNLSSSTGFFLGVKNTGELEVFFNNRVILRSPKVKTENWHHVAVSRSNNIWCLYLDGVKVSCYNGLFDCLYLENLLFGTLDALYRCRLKIGLREYKTRNALLRVRGATIVFSQNTPFTAIGTLGGYIDLTISAYVQEQPGRALTYQWEANIDITNPAIPWTVLPGRTNPTLTIGPITNDSINQAYRVRVTCGAVSAYSNVTTISVAGA